MKKMEIWAVTVIVIFVALSVADASSIVQSFGFSNQNSETLLFDGFDSADGKLTEVRLSFSIGVTASGECIRSIVPYCAIHLRLSLGGDPSPLPLVGRFFTIASVALPPQVDSRNFLGRGTRSLSFIFNDPNDFVDMPSIPIEMSLLYPIDGFVLDRTISSQEVSGSLTYFLVTACDFDFDSDGDMDGKDLAHYGKNFSVHTIDDFAESFGRDDCLIE